MRIATFAIICAPMIIVGGCAPAPQEPAYAPPPPTDIAQAVLRDASGNEVGDALLTQLDQGIRVVIRVAGLSPGVKAAHLHMIGQCDAPDFTSAGGHWNPEGREHGRDNPSGQHMGDMPNLIVGQGGRGLLEVTITGGSIDGSDRALLDADGAAVMIHAGPDDYRSDPTGNAGGRIACGVISPG